ncbi:MAG: hypothetical protein H7X77_06980 [Anaerolineae bacterium]|nr:hypothetical protein [Anaerolineae bacterium]
MKSRLLVLVLLFPLLLVACNRAEVTDVQRSADGGIDATVTFTEDDLNTAIQEALAAGENPLLRNPQVDLQPGQIVINGEHDQRDGSGTVSGTLTVAVTIEEGQLKTTVTAATIESVPLSDTRVTQFNERLAEAFARRAARDRGVITVKAVTITDTTFEVVVNAQRG